MGSDERPSAPVPVNNCNQAKKGLENSEKYVFGICYTHAPAAVVRTKLYTYIIGRIA